MDGGYKNAHVLRSSQNGGQKWVAGVEETVHAHCPVRSHERAGGTRGMNLDRMRSSTPAIRRIVRLAQGNRRSPAHSLGVP